MRCLVFSSLLVAAFALTPARAEVQIQIDKAAQKMTVTVDGTERYSWPVSTGIAEYDTPDGEFQPFRMERDHYSREWDDAPMPYSIFFTQQGHAIHGTYHKSLGRPASHGCVRLSVANAATLYALVKEQGVKNAHVTLTGDIPDSDAGKIARQEPSYDDPPPRRTRVVHGNRGISHYYYYGAYAPPPRYVGRGIFPFGW